MHAIPMLNSVRNAEPVDLDHLATVWHDAWHEAHAEIVPPELVSCRTWGNFRERLDSAYPSIRVVGALGTPLGFCQVKGDELYQLFVAPEGRGGTVAEALVADAEAILRAKACPVAWLACAIGNERAARFYQRCGWSRTGVVLSSAVTPHGDFPLEVWRYEKRLA